MDFGVRLTIQGEMGAPGSAIADYAMKMGIRADELGYHSAWIPDHINNARVGNDQKGPSLECFTSITALLMHTKQIILGPHVYCNTFRHPGLLAKMTATLDELSKGRIILSLGGGWFEKEATSHGYSWPDHHTRMEQTREAYQIIKALWTEDEVTFHGNYYTLENAYQDPKPYTKPHPPIWVPGESKVAREIMQELGDVWLIYSKSPDVVRRLKQDMSEFCGREIKLAISAVFVSGMSEDKILAYAQKFVGEREHRFKVKPTLETVLESNIIGTIDHCRDKVNAYKDAGVDHLIIQPMPPYEGMELFASEIMSRF